MHPHIFFPSVAVAPSVRRWTTSHLHKHFLRGGKGPSGRWSALRLGDGGFNPGRVTPKTSKRCLALGINGSPSDPRAGRRCCSPLPRGIGTHVGKEFYMLGWCMPTISGDFNLCLETPELPIGMACAGNRKRKYENDFVSYPLVEWSHLHWKTEVSQTTSV